MKISKTQLKKLIREEISGSDFVGRVEHVLAQHVHHSWAAKHAPKVAASMQSGEMDHGHPVWEEDVLNIFGDLQGWAVIKDLNRIVESRLIETPDSMDQVFDVAGQLEEIQGQIGDLANQALQLLRSLPRDEWGREVEAARSYWYGHIMSALGGDVGADYAGGSMDTIQDTINALEDGGYAESEDDY